MEKSPCDYAKERYSSIFALRKLWSYVMVVFGITLALFLTACVVLFIRETWLPGGLTVIGTIVNGAGLKWLAAQRSTAVAEEREVFREMLNVCGGPDPNKNFEQALEWAKQQPWLQQIQSEATNLVAKSIVSSKMASALFHSIFRGHF